MRQTYEYLGYDEERYEKQMAAGPSRKKFLNFIDCDSSLVEYITGKSSDPAGPDVRLPKSLKKLVLDKRVLSLMLASCDRGAIRYINSFVHGPSIRVMLTALSYFQLTES